METGSGKRVYLGGKNMKWRFFFRSSLGKGNVQVMKVLRFSGDCRNLKELVMNRFYVDPFLCSE